MAIVTNDLRCGGCGNDTFNIRSKSHGSLEACCAKCALIVAKTAVPTENRLVPESRGVDQKKRTC